MPNEIFEVNSHSPDVLSDENRTGVGSDLQNS
jgi:hypothetical protein